MKAARLHGVKDIRVEAAPDPTPQADQILLATRAVTVCGSDLHYYLEGAIGSDRPNEPHILGHEFAAEVIEDGPLPKGTLVAVDPNRACGTCEWCVEGHPNLCPNVQFSGVPPYHGALAEYVVARPEEVVSVPESFTPSDAAMLEPLGVALHALDLAHLRPLDSVGVVGCGPIGLLILQVAGVSGAGLRIAVDPVAERRELALALGAEHAFASVDEAKDALGSRGMDVVVEATDAQRGPEDAAHLTRIGGKLVLVGIPEGNRFSMDAALVRRKGLTIKMARRMGHVYPRAIELVQRQLVTFEPLVTHRFGLDDAAKAFAMQADRADGMIKSCIELP